MTDSSSESNPSHDPAVVEGAADATDQLGVPQEADGDAFVVAWNPVPSASRVATSSRSLRMSLVTSLLFPAVLVVIWFATGRSNRALITIAIISLAISAVFAIFRIIRLRGAQRALAAVPRGTAMRISRDGITVNPLSGSGSPGQFLPWHEVIAVRAEGKSTGVGPDLVVAHTGGEWRAPLSFLDALPGTIDSALRAFSGARVGLDLSGLDAIW